MEQDFSGQSTNVGRSNFIKKRTSLNNLVSGLGKLPPQALDLEEAVLGALMLEKNALSEVIDILKPQLMAIQVASAKIDMQTRSYSNGETYILDHIQGISIQVA